MVFFSGPAIKKKDRFFEALKKNSGKFLVATKFEGALVAGPLKKDKKKLRLPLAAMLYTSM